MRIEISSCVFRTADTRRYDDQASGGGIVTPFREIVSLTHNRLGDMTDEEARAEGFPYLESYRALIVRMHRGMEWDPDHLVWVHRFQEVELA